MTQKFLAIADFTIRKNLESFEIKKDKTYTEEELVEFLGSKGALKFKLKCTALKRVLEVQSSEEGSLEEVSSEEKPEEPMFLANKQIKKENKIVFKKGSKIKISELEGLEISKLVEEGFLSEIKIIKESELKD